MPSVLKAVPTQETVRDLVCRRVNEAESLIRQEELDHDAHMKKLRENFAEIFAWSQRIPGEVLNMRASDFSKIWDINFDPLSWARTLKR